MLSEVFTPNMINGIQVEKHSLTAGASSLRITVKPNAVLRIVNTHATQIAYVNFGDGTETATATDIPIKAAYGELFIRVPNSAKSMSYLGSGAATPLLVAVGA